MHNAILLSLEYLLSVYGPVALCPQNGLIRVQYIVQHAPRPPQCCLLRHAIHCKSIQVTSTIFYVISAACLLCMWHIMKFIWYFQFEPKVEKLLPLFIIISFQVWVRIFGEVWCFFFWSYHRLYGILRLIYASMQHLHLSSKCHLWVLKEESDQLKVQSLWAVFNYINGNADLQDDQ